MAAAELSSPLRGLSSIDDGGVAVVRDPKSSWQDGSEQILLERMQSGIALDSLSDELEATAQSWPERYHLATARANFLRTLALPSGARVLEVGAGCGAITRYLGEQCAFVDAVEPTLARAKVAAARTAELPGVQVFCAELSDIPHIEAYDVVVIVGVLEYVGNGGRDLAPYLQFLSSLQALLVEGGNLVLAIENPLGVKYLAAAPEDHSGIVFHSVEGYPIDGPARTFTRAELISLHMESGFEQPRVLGAFPDYKLSRFVFDQAMLDGPANLAVEIPRFPSPDWVLARPDILEEKDLWRQLVKAEVGLDFANSFVVIAPKGSTDKNIWAENRLGSYLSLYRQRELSVINHIERHAEWVGQVRTERLGVGESDGLHVLPSITRLWWPSESAVNRALQGTTELQKVLHDYKQMYEEKVHDGDSVRLDYLPHNLVYVDDTPHAIDDEWRATSIDAKQVLERAIVLFSRDLLASANPERWGLDSSDELVRFIGAELGIVVTEEWLENALRNEAELQAVISVDSANVKARSEITASILADLKDDLGPASAQRRAVRAEEMSSVMRLDALTARDELALARVRIGELHTEYDELGERAHTFREERDSLQVGLEDAERRIAEFKSHPIRTAFRMAKRRIVKA